MNKTRTMIVFLLIICGACKKTATTSPDTLIEKDTDYLNKTTYSNIGEITTGNLTAQRGTNSAIKDFAAMMVADHTAAQTALSTIAQSKSFGLPTATDQQHTDMATMLSSLSGRAYDSTYIYMQVADHDNTIAIFRDEINNGHNTDVMAYALNNMPVLERHRRMADSLAKTLFPGQ